MVTSKTNKQTNYWTDLSRSRGPITTLLNTGCVTVTVPWKCNQFYWFTHADTKGAKNMERFTNLRVILAQGPC